MIIFSVDFEHKPHLHQPERQEGRKEGRKEGTEESEEAQANIIVLP
jgi:hypothetical protein